ncbi:hypothetical protein JCGZ_22037 [Jatropha curcas]|uniref:Uncharacterized protein n=1 Tax=Jatropha curcas TaxID=180498 RepID=A0A067JWD3_JATCU|nr:hypothetical protein JCGZ_22037 [Jatropha curcas]
MILSPQEIPCGCHCVNTQILRLKKPGSPDCKPSGRTGGHSEKFTESMPIWYLKRPENYEDRRTGPGIFFGGTELPKNPLERKTSEWTAAAVHGGSYRPPPRVFL